MSNLEKKIDALIRFVLCENAEETAEAAKALRALLSESAEVTPATTAPNYQAKVQNALLELGVPDSNLGHLYLMYIIPKVIERPEICRDMIKTLYPMVARAYDTTPARAERAIRHSIETAWDRTSFDTIARYFGNTVHPSKGKPTNTEFISRVANALR